jgi:hypothetical protein
MLPLIFKNARNREKPKGSRLSQRRIAMNKGHPKEILNNYKIILFGTAGSPAMA